MSGRDLTVEEYGLVDRLAEIVLRGMDEIVADENLAVMALGLAYARRTVARIHTPAGLERCLAQIAVGMPEVITAQFEEKANRE